MSRLSLAPLALLGAATLILAGCGGGGGSNNPADAVTQKVSGFVWDNDTAAPIVGATVTVQGTTIKATTAADGSYTIGPLIPTRSYTMTVTQTGYVTGVAKLLSQNSTLQGPTINLQAATAPTTIQNTTGGPVLSNATLDGNTATVTIPANGLPGGAASAGISATLIVGTATPGAPVDTTKTAYPAINVGVTGPTGNFASNVTVQVPLAFAGTAGTQYQVLTQGADGSWNAATGVMATVSQDGKSASFSTNTPGTYALSLPIKATASVTSTNTQQIPGPYTDPVTVPLTGTQVNWSAQSNDGRDFLDSAFTQSQRDGNVNTPGDLDAQTLVIHPRGTALISVVKNNLSVNFTTGGFTVQQTGSSSSPNGTITNLSYISFTTHQQGTSSGG